MVTKNSKENKELKEKLKKIAEIADIKRSPVWSPEFYLAKLMKIQKICDD